MLYTITTDGTIRVFLPVLDQPNYLQLHGALDAYSTLPLSFHPSSRNSTPSAGFVLDREVMSAALTKILKDFDKTNDDSGIHRLREIQDEGWDLFLHVHEDRSLVVGAVAVRTFLISMQALWLIKTPFVQHIDRRPPTLLRNFTLSQTPPGVLDFYPTSLYILPHTNPNKLTLITCSPLESYEISPVSFFNGQPEGIRLIARIGRTLQAAESWTPVLSTSPPSSISRFVRTAEGKCIGIVRKEGIELQLVSERGTQLIWKQRSSAADNLVVLDKGARYCLVNVLG